jgi:hypothetical protein
MGEGQGVEHEQAWARFMEAERHELENRRNGHLRKLLDDPCRTSRQRSWTAWPLRTKRGLKRDSLN